jgi:hypothetical protein
MADLTIATSVDVLAPVSAEEAAHRYKVFY